VLNSYPSATAVIYLDFDGQVVEGTTWGTNIVALSPGYDATKITDIWKRVATDMEPFNLNVTTDESVYLNAPATQRIRCIITPSNEWYGGSSSAGGVAKLRSFTWSGDTPCWIFSDNLLNGTKYIAEACSHETGHTLGLSHDGKSGVTTYYAGHGSGAVGWAPIRSVSNLDIIAELYDPQGNLIASANPSTLLNASLSTVVEAGTYFLHVRATDRYRKLPQKPILATSHPTGCQQVKQVAVAESSTTVAISTLQKPTSDPSTPSTSLSVVFPQEFRSALSIAKQTNGAYDPTLGHHSYNWRMTRKKGSLPSTHAITQAQTFSGYRHIHLDTTQKTITTNIGHIKFDLGGIAKGYAADRMLTTLKQHGITRASITAGGDVRLGDPPPK